MKGFSSHDGGKTYAPEFLLYCENEPSLKRKRSSPNPNVHEAKKFNEGAQSDVDMEGNESDVEGSKLNYEASQSSIEDTSSDDEKEIKTKNLGEDDDDADEILDELNREFNEEMGNNDDLETFITSTKNPRSLLNELEMCSLSGSETEKNEFSKDC